MSRRLVVFGAVFALLLGAFAPATLAAGPAPAGFAAKFTSGGQFVVQLKELPVVAYDGSIKGYKATKPAPGTKIDPLSTDVVKYVGYLTTRHDTVLKQVGAAKKLYDYVYTYDGFLAKLTAKQANQLAANPGVEAVSPNRRFDVDTSSTPAFLGLSDPGTGLWAQLGGPTGTRTVSGAGENIVIGDVDSGIWPESKSFSDRNAAGQLIYANTPPSAFHGKCDGAAQVIDPTWDASRCNKKLVGARHFNASWGGNAALEAERPWEFQSPRDYNGHGTHTASTAGGNFGVQATGPAAGFGAISGMAPRARIAAYKALWSTESGDTASGFTGDLVAAIDQAVADGADVINYSVSGSTTNFLDPVEVSYFFAANAGIFVSQSAGNSGPTTGTVAHPSPWTTTVAAGTHNRNGSGSVTLGNNVTYFGASIAAATAPAPLIDSIDAGLTGANAGHLALCYGASDGDTVLDPAKVAGKIVVCDRGTTGRTNKSLAVQDAGGVGMILVNTNVNSINADFHFVPTVHLTVTDRAAVKAYAQTVNPTATINQSTLTNTDPAPFTASFSSRGPLAAGGGDILKPDVIAPGQDILAAVAPTAASHGLSFNLLSGTSMSAPHVAGVGALLKQAHPTWSVMAIKSALMTSAYDVLDGANTDPTVIFSQGAGHIQPNSATDPGLVYDSGFNDWRNFLKGQGLCNFCFGTTPATAIDASDLNLASIAIGDLAGVQTVTRTVKNVGGSPATYNASTTGLDGITVNVSPNNFTLINGASQTFTVAFTRTTAALNAYVGGQLTWTQTGANPHIVRSPMVIKPVALAAPASVSGAGAPINYNIKFGYTGSFTATPRGLIPAQVTTDTVDQDPDQTFDPAVATGTKSYPVTIPAGTTFARFQLFDADVAPGSDIDLYLYKGTTRVGSSESGTSAEVISLVSPAAGTDYVVYVHGWGLTSSPSPFKLHTWILGGTDQGNMIVTAPSSATLGATGTITLTFSGLAPTTKYLGSVAYSGSTGMPNPTIVTVNTP